MASRPVISAVAPDVFGFRILRVLRLSGFGFRTSRTSWFSIGHGMQGFSSCVPQRPEP